jgi:hypothetical protein
MGAYIIQFCSVLQECKIFAKFLYYEKIAKNNFECK